MMNWRVCLTLTLVFLMSIFSIIRVEAEENFPSQVQLVDATLTIESASAIPGSENNLVSVSMDNTVPVYAIEFVLIYDATVLTFVDVDSTSRNEFMSFFALLQSLPPKSSSID